MPFTLPAPTGSGVELAQTVPVWANFLALATYLNTLPTSTSMATSFLGAASGNYTAKTNLLRITGAAAGGGATAANVGSGGAGETIEGKLFPTTAGAVIAYVVGAGANGASGGNTSIGYIVLHGGIVGDVTYGTGGGWQHGISPGDPNMFEDASTSSGANGGDAGHKGGSAGLFVSTGLQSGASSPWGPGGAAGSDAPATSYGAGAGAAAVAKKGADGLLIIEEIGT